MVFLVWFDSGFGAEVESVIVVLAVAALFCWLGCRGWSRPDLEEPFLLS